MPRNLETPRQARMIPMTDEQHEHLKALASQEGTTISQYVDDLFSGSRQIKVAQKPRNRNIQMSDKTWREIRKSGMLLGISAAAALRGAIEAEYIRSLNHHWGADDQSL